MFLKEVIGSFYCMKIIDLFIGKYKILMLGSNVLIYLVYTKSVE